jgi:hypothetical protein
MKKLFFIAFLLVIQYSAKAQIKYYDANAFPLLGKATEHTVARYDRLPDSLMHKVRTPLWTLSRNTAGMAIRFRSNSTTIAAKWEVLYNNEMNHMSPTGIKGLDLYCLQKNKWRFVNTGRPIGKVNQAVIISNMIPKEREYLLYLPLYDGIISLSIGIDSLSDISLPKVQLPIRKKPIVFYGTSILQGGCASRPGMASTNIISRYLNREIINLGFSGNGRLDLEVADVMAHVDAGAFVLDFAPNASVEEMKQRTVKFYEILRKQHAQVPIIFIEDPIFTHSYFDQVVANEVKTKNETLKLIFKSLKRKGDRQIYLISSNSMLGYDGEGTVDGIHFTDLGFMRYVDLVYPILKKVLR